MYDKDAFINMGFIKFTKYKYDIHQNLDTNNFTFDLTFPFLIIKLNYKM